MVSLLLIFDYLKTKKLSLGVKMMQAAWKLNFTPQVLMLWVYKMCLVKTFCLFGQQFATLCFIDMNFQKQMYKCTVSLCLCIYYVCACLCIEYCPMEWPTRGKNCAKCN